MASETTARNIMSTEILCAVEGMTIEQLLKIIINNRITGLPVVNRKGEFIGVVSEFDIMMQIVNRGKISSEVFQYKFEYSKKVDCIQETMKLKDITKQFVKTKFRRLPVVNNKGKLVGIISRRDLMRTYYYRARLT